MLAPAHDLFRAVLAEQQRLGPDRAALFDLDYLSLSDPDSLDEIDVVDPSRGAVLCAAIKMPSLSHVREGEDVGHAGGPPVRLIDNIILQPTTV
ncbi:hypothetical protein CDD83_7480 [Cordyceps sp. RAO-2017]|nr:hypothetical protein CDD83_7480 [Cordyceps sp. RAO-2017]